MDKIKWIKVAPFIVLAGLAILLFKALSLNPNQLPTERMGEPLPTFSLPELGKMESQMNNQQLPSEPMLVHVWATWCGVCRKEFPTLMSLKERGIPIIGINYRDDPEQASQFLEQNGNPFVHNLADLSGKFGLDLGIYGTPETYIIDAQANLRYRHVGLMDDEEDVAQLLLALKEVSEE